MLVTNNFSSKGAGGWGFFLEGLWSGKDYEEFAIKLSNIFTYLH
jgi:hypothetical protein